MKLMTVSQVATRGPRLPFVWLLLLALWSLPAGMVNGSPPPGGIAPVNPPAGGFGIDGNLIANTPLGDVGDWLVNTNTAPGTGGAVLNLAGEPLNSATTFHFNDPYNGDDNIFAGGLKWKDNPNTWQWTTGKPSSKTDINNVLLHIATDTDAHIWAVVSADRFSTSGDSYIDFEFLQNPLTRNSNGTFTSTGSNDGRTAGDLLLSLAFTGGGKVADFFAWRWLTNGSGGFTYTDVTASLPVGRVFVALNSNNIAVPYGAFGSTNYAPNAFAEAAIDLTALLGNFDPCLSVGFKTIMVKTKSSASDSASIEDFIDPIQFTLNIGPSADAGPDQVKCSEGGETAFTLHGIATPGMQPVASATWSAVSGTVMIDAANSLVTTARVSSASATLRLTVVQQNGCTETDDVVLNVVQPPVCSISGPASACLRATAQFSAPAGMASYSWSVTGNGAISGPTNQPSMTVLAGSVCGENFTVLLNATSNVCSIACSTDVLVADTTAPALACPADVVLECPADVRTNVTGVATAQDTCSRVTVTYSDAATNGCGGTKVIARTWTATDECGNTTNCVQTITVLDSIKPTLTCPPNRILECPADTSTNNTGIATASDACGSVAINFSDVVSNACGGTKVIWRTWTATDECGNSSSGVQTITGRDTTKPIITCPPNRVLECPADTTTNNTGVATASDTCGSVTISSSDVVSNACGGTKVISRTWTATDECNNSASCVQTITVQDTTKPTITCPPNRLLECPADTTTNNTGVATASDACGSVTITSSDVVSNACAGAKVIWRTWTATDQCGNNSSCVQTITVRDTTKPAITCPPNRILECPADTGTNLTGVATASDACGSVAIGYSDVVSTNCGFTKVISRTWTATDECGNSSSCVQTITVRDTTPPTIICPTNLVLECPAVITTNVTGVATASDTCGAVTIRYGDSVNTTCGGAKVISRTWTATDACGNSSSCVQTITVRDTIKPTITCPPDVALECGASTAPSATGTATAQDTCSSVTVSYSDSVSNICGGARVITRTWTATDACGNSTNCVQTIAVRDTTPPDITCRVVCTYSQGGWSGGGSPAQLLADNYTTVFPQGVTLGIYNPGNGNAAPNGLYWQPNAAGLAALQSAASVGGGSGTAISQDALNPTDTYGAGGLGRQTLALTFNIAFNSAGLIGAGPNDFGSLIYNKPGDSLSGQTVSQILEAANRALAGLGLPAGYDFSSLSGLIENLNVSFHDCTVSSFAANYLSAPSVVVQCVSQVPPPNSSFVSASDACSSVTLSALPDVITEQTCPNRLVILRTWVARDACGNSNSCTHRIVVNDTNPPVLVCPPNRVLECPADISTNVTGVATATDNCGPATVSFSDVVSNICGGAKVIFRTWTATDGCGNTASCIQTITVLDTTPPTLSSPANRTVTNGLAWDFDTPVATHTCGSATVRIVSTVTNSSSPDRFTVTRTWEAADECGNKATRQQTITVVVLPPPLLELLRIGPNKLMLRWPQSASGYRLETADGWNSPNWKAMPVAPVVSNGFCCVEFTPTSSQKTYRLSKAPPMLELQRIGAGALRLGWPSSPSGFQLESSDSLTAPNWSPVFAEPVTTNSFCYVELTPISKQKFYRLKKPSP